MTYNSNLMN